MPPTAVGGIRDRARDLELVGQITTRRQAIAWFESTITNRIPYLLVDLAAQIFSAAKIDLKIP